MNSKLLAFPKINSNGIQLIRFVRKHITEIQFDAAIARMNHCGAYMDDQETYVSIWADKDRAIREYEQIVVVEL